MTLLSKCLIPLATGALLLSACGQSSENAVEGEPSQVAAGNGGELDEALRCWALTSGAYFQHMAMANETGNLPKPDEAVYAGWAKKLAILSFDKGMGFKAFNDMKSQAQGDVRVYSLTVKPDHISAVQACIDTTPPPTSEPDPSWPSDS